MNPRKRAALQAMAAQGTSPHEREIARHKLRTMRDDPEDAADASWRQAWADQQEHDRIAAAQARAKQEAEIAAIVRRWEAGTFAGLSVEVGATDPKRRYRR